MSSAPESAAVTSQMPATDPRVAAWREAGRHLPVVLRDFHDQKAVFRAMHEVQASAGGPSRLVREPTWVEGHCYVIDQFLWFMARHGYSLQRSRAALPFTELDETLAAVSARQKQGWKQPLEGDSAEAGSAMRPPAGTGETASLSAKGARARISFAHEVNGLWRLELNGVTLSRHETRDALEQAVTALRRALGLGAPSS